MAKSTIHHSIVSYGIYDKWEAAEKNLPKVINFTLDVPAKIDIEFGFIINIKKGKGKKVRYCIYHPNITDENGKIRVPFSGEVYIKNNNWHFYLGDTIWEPLHDKLGHWRMTIECDNQIVADKTFIISQPNEDIKSSLWTRAGY
jgi:hypothetical protein